MIFNLRNVMIFITIITLTAVIRIYQIDKVLPNLNIDEASEGYNAYSLLLTGKDRYGQSLPILFRSFGSFQAPLYTYLTIIPIYFLGNSVFAVRFVSIISGTILVCITFFLFSIGKHSNGLSIYFKNKKKVNLAIISAITLSLSPWTVFFSRIGTEASLGVTLFAISFFLFYLSLNKFWLFPLATFILGLSTHAYYSERIISILFLMGFILLFRKKILLKKKILIVGLSFFLLTQIPNFLIVNSGAFTRRISQVDYLSDQFFQSNSGKLHDVPFGRLLFINREFISHYLAYFSLRDLFFNPDPQPERSIPDLSVFYSWMLVPFLLGIRVFFKERSSPLVKMLILTMLVGPIPAALTRDPFYTLRTLVFLWCVTIMIAFGISSILDKISLRFIRYSLVIFIISYSTLSLYISYFILFKYERTTFNYSYLKLLEKIKEFPNQNFIVDNSRDLAIGIRTAFFNKYEPQRLQKDFRSKFSDPYYSSVEFDEPYNLDNIKARPIIWRVDLCKKQVLVGDLLAISSGQVSEHYLNLVFDIKDMAGDVTLQAYYTDPNLACRLSNKY